MAPQEKPSLAKMDPESNCWSISHRNMLPQQHFLPSLFAVMKFLTFAVLHWERNFHDELHSLNPKVPFHVPQHSAQKPVSAAVWARPIWIMFDADYMCDSSKSLGYPYCDTEYQWGWSGISRLPACLSPNIIRSYCATQVCANIHGLFMQLEIARIRLCH